jgi:MFS family permease
MGESKSNIFKEKGKILIPILLFIIFQSAFNAFSPILQKMSDMFPNTSTTIIQMVMTFPSLMSIPVSLFSGLLAPYIHKKRLVQIALIVMFIGGMLPVLIHTSIYAVFVSSGLIGIGQGLLISVSGALISEHFDGNQRGMVFGFKQTASSIGITVLTLLVGYLTVIAWFDAYLVYLLVIPIWFLVTKFLPLGSLDEKLVGKGVGLNGVKNLLTPSFIYMCVMCFLMGALQFAFYTNIAMTISEKGLGTAAAVGQVTALNSIMTIVIGLCYVIILRIFKKYSLSLAMLVLGASYFIFFFSTSFSIVAFGGVVFGIGAAMQQASSLYYVSESIPKGLNTLGLAISITCISLGVTLSPVIVNTARTLAFDSSTATSGMLVAGCGYAILLVVEIVRETFLNKKSQIGMPQKNG